MHDIMEILSSFWSFKILIILKAAELSSNDVLKVKQTINGANHTFSVLLTPWKKP